MSGTILRAFYVSTQVISTTPPCKKDITTPRFILLTPTPHCPAGLLEGLNETH